MLPQSFCTLCCKYTVVSLYIVSIGNLYMSYYVWDRLLTLDLSTYTYVATVQIKTCNLKSQTTLILNSYGTGYIIIASPASMQTLRSHLILLSVFMVMQYMHPEMGSNCMTLYKVRCWFCNSTCSFAKSRIAKLTDSSQVSQSRSP